MKNILLLFLVLCSFNLFGQAVGFEFTNNDAPVEVGIYGFENSQGNFIIASTAAEQDLLQSTNVVFFELNDQGELLNKLEIPTEGNALSTRLFEMEDHYLSIGRYQSNGSGFLQILQVSFDFELLKDSLIYIEEGFLSLNSEVINDTIYCTASFGTPSNSIIIKLNPPHYIDEIYNINNTFLPSSLIRNKQTGHHIVCGALDLGLYDHNFNFLYYIDKPFEVKLTESTLKRLPDSTFLVAAVSRESSPGEPGQQDLAVIKYNFEYESIRSQYFGLEGDSVDLIAPFGSIDFVNPNKIYVGGTGNKIIGPDLLINNPTYFLLSQFDIDLNKNWERRYGGDAFYRMVSLTATEDGGCLMVGFRRDYINTPEQGELYVLKVDGNGDILSSTTIPLNNKFTKTYPNPFSDYLQIDIVEKYAGVDGMTLELLDINGRVIIHQNIDGLTNNLNTSELAVGTYLVLLKDENGVVVSREKVVKGVE